MILKVELTVLPWKRNLHNVFHLVHKATLESVTNIIIEGHNSPTVGHLQYLTTLPWKCDKLNLHMEILLSQVSLYARDPEEGGPDKGCVQANGLPRGRKVASPKMK